MANSMENMHIDVRVYRVNRIIIIIIIMTPMF